MFSDLMHLFFGEAPKEFNNKLRKAISEDILSISIEFLFPKMKHP